MRQWRIKNPERTKFLDRQNRERNGRAQLLKKYGLTVQDYSAMLSRQQGVCAICGVLKIERLSVDHCHTTGKVRGLLCNHCNNGLGKFRDSVFNLQSAIEYLKERV